ncbi:arsenate reductase (glutaredoxin) [Thiomicrorhabdus sp.]|uniref:arsenate reductase (glutaredoxin) n=1 Tax=Thiomicrorhabdus sp. TaxID=2039724 RepID=UPI002AA68AA1|nr:arsenate reductase (glutaredoxin) [Thiomicrorhabdus sp.]
MEKQAIIYHNPRCSKSRKSLEILLENGYTVNEVKYLETPPSKIELADLCDKMGKTPFEIIRTGESLFKELGLSKMNDKSTDEWLEILVTHPKLIERPIVKIGNKVIMGRPPENVLTIM